MSPGPPGMECGPGGLSGFSRVPRLCRLPHPPEGGSISSHLPTGTAAGLLGGHLWGAETSWGPVIPPWEGLTQKEEATCCSQSLTPSTENPLVGPTPGPRVRTSGLATEAGIQTCLFKYFNIFCFSFWGRGNRSYMQSRVKQERDGPVKRKHLSLLSPSACYLPWGTSRAVSTLASLHAAHTPIHGRVGCLPPFLHR